MNDKEEVEFLINLLMKEDDGFDPRSPIPQDQQQEAQRAKYRESLEMNPLSSSVTLAINTISTEYLPSMKEEEAAFIAQELMEAGRILANMPDSSKPELVNPNLGLSEFTIRTILSWARLHYDAEQYQRSMALFTLLTVFEPESGRYWLCIGASEQELGNYEDAIAAYERVRTLSPKEPRACLYLAECYHRQHYDLEAQKALEEGKALIAALPEPMEEYDAVIRYLERTVATPGGV